MLSELEFGDDDLICVVGPTASQKTELAIRLCERWGGEVVGADSVQIYKYFDLGSGKPTAEEQARARHHLVGVLEPSDAIEAARYASMAAAVIDEVRSRARRPIVCGGSLLWVRALVYGLAQAPPADEQIRARIRGEAQEIGRQAVYDRLKSVDPETAARLNPQDLVRVERALEVWELTGQSISELHRAHRAMAPRYAARFVGIRWDKDELEARIRQRCEGWLGAGWIDEVRDLINRGYRDTRPMGSVGYKQVVAYLDGNLPRDELSLQITRSTKVFARRQRTWLRDAPVMWLDPL